MQPNFYPIFSIKRFWNQTRKQLAHGLSLGVASLPGSIYTTNAIYALHSAPIGEKTWKKPPKSQFSVFWQFSSDDVLGRSNFKLHTISWWISSRKRCFKSQPIARLITTLDAFMDRSWKRPKNFRGKMRQFSVPFFSLFCKFYKSEYSFSETFIIVTRI